MLEEVFPSVKACHAASRIGRMVDKAIEGSELTPAAYRLLGQLESGGEAAAAALADKLLVSRPTVSATVDWLEERGYVIRTPDSDDGRRIRISETQNGAKAREACDGLVTLRLAEIISNLDKGAAIRAIAALEDLHHALDLDKLNRHSTLMTQQRLHKR